MQVPHSEKVNQEFRDTESQSHEEAQGKDGSLRFAMPIEERIRFGKFLHDWRQNGGRKESGVKYRQQNNQGSYQSINKERKGNANYYPGDEKE